MPNLIALNTLNRSSFLAVNYVLIKAVKKINVVAVLRIECPSSSANAGRQV